MINYLKFSLLIIMSLFVFSCQQEEDISTDLEQSNAIEQLSEKDFSCVYSFVDNNWGPNAFRNNFIVNQAHTDFIYMHNRRIASVFGVPTVPLSFIHDNSGQTFNALSFSSGRIDYGEDIYRQALSKGLIAPVAILAHEIGHQLQYRFNLPTRQENTVRATELEADGYAGYYMRRPNGYDATWSEAGPAFAFAFDIGDFNTSSPGHHGTPRQRRSATRLGWYLGAYNLTPRSFDSNFFYYYNQYVLPGNLKLSKEKRTEKEAEMDVFIESKLEELVKLNTGELSADDFINLE